MAEKEQQGLGIFPMGGGHVGDLVQEGFELLFQGDGPSGNFKL